MCWSFDLIIIIDFKDLIKEPILFSNFVLVAGSNEVWSAIPLKLDLWLRFIGIWNGKPRESFGNQLINKDIFQLMSFYGPAFNMLRADGLNIFHRHDRLGICWMNESSEFKLTLDGDGLFSFVGENHLLADLQAAQALGGVNSKLILSAERSIEWNNRFIIFRFVGLQLLIFKGLNETSCKKTADWLFIMWIMKMNCINLLLILVQP